MKAKLQNLENYTLQKCSGRPIQIYFKSHFNPIENKYLTKFMIIQKIFIGFVLLLYQNKKIFFPRSSDFLSEILELSLGVVAATQSRIQNKF